jgi:hypothetical protein
VHFADFFEGERALALFVCASTRPTALDMFGKVREIDEIAEVLALEMTFSSSRTLPPSRAAAIPFARGG